MLNWALTRRSLCAVFFGGILSSGLVLGSPVGAQPEGSRFLTGPRSGAPLEIALDHLFGHEGAGSRSAQRRVEESPDFWVASQHTNRRTGTTHIVLGQRVGGLDVLGGDVSIHVSREGEVMLVHDRFASTAAQARAAHQPLLSPIDALAVAADRLGLARPAAAAVSGPGADQEYHFAGAGISRAPVPVRLRYWRHAGGSLRMVWNLEIATLDGAHYFEFSIDAMSGEVLEQSDRVRNDSYRVFAPPLESPNSGGRTLEVDPRDSVASPFAWHDPNDLLFETRGNNVVAQVDDDGNNTGGFRPWGGAGLDFDFALDLQASPATQQSAAVAHLFYWSNWLHDVHYAYGFDEAAGNFQLDQYGNGGLGADPVQADAQDGAGLDNARFFSMPDGTAPRMEMFLFQPFFAELEVNLPTSIGGFYPAGNALFGPLLSQVGIAGDVAAAIDSVEMGGGTSTDACSAILNPSELVNRVALVDRGGCFFVDKVRNVQAAGAMGAIIANNQGNFLVPEMGGSGLPGGDPDITIASIFISWSNGRLLRDELPGVVDVVLRSSSPASRRDSSFDNSLIAHEYGHGVSMRLVGGPATVNCLDEEQAAGMGEGWSDFWAIALTATGSETRSDPRAIGTYVDREEARGSGFRKYQFTTDLAANPQTYVDIVDAFIPNRSTPERSVHGVGEIWASALWEVYWNLVDEYGFDPDIIDGTGGNNLALELVMDSLKLLPCEPTFLDARDAMLMADQVQGGGANECAIYEGFAKRGMGLSADDGGSAAAIVVSEAFDVPVVCPEPSASLLACGALAAISCLRRRRYGAMSPGALKPKGS